MADKHEKAKARRRRRIMQRDGVGCYLCGWKHNLTIHHIKKIADGGSNDIDNICQLCEACHCIWHQNEAKDFQQWIRQMRVYLSRIIYE